MADVSPGSFSSMTRREALRTHWRRGGAGVIILGMAAIASPLFVVAAVLFGR